MKNSYDNWTYIHEYKRVQGKVVQLKDRGTWKTINFREDRPPNSNAPQ